MKISDKLGWGPNCTIPEYKVKQLLPLIRGKTILDVGCGPGHFVNALNIAGYHATGIDINKKYIEFAKKNYSGNFLQTDAAKLPLKNKQFDTVFVRSILEHVKDDLEIIKEALRVGKNVIIIVPQPTPKNLIKSGVVYFHYQDKTHLRNYTKKSITQLIQKSGAKIIKFQQIENLPSRKLFNQLFIGRPHFKRTINKIFFTIFKEKKYFEELLVIIKS